MSARTSARYSDRYSVRYSRSLREEKRREREEKRREREEKVFFGCVRWAGASTQRASLATAEASR